MTRATPTPDEHTPATRKSTLFCWGCDHASPVDGDWDRWTRGHHLEYVCPVCETTIMKRPRRDRDPIDPSSTQSPRTWHHALRTTLHVWRLTVGIGLTSLRATVSNRSGRR